MNWPFDGASFGFSQPLVSHQGGETVLSTFNGIYGPKPQLIEAGALMTLILPLLLFIFARRFFVQGIVITGVDK